MAISVSIDFPLNSKGSTLFHCAASDYSGVHQDGLWSYERCSMWSYERSPWCSSTCAADIENRNHFFCLYQQNNDLYINDLPDNVCNIAISADDTTLYCKCDQASDWWQQLKLASELEFDLWDQGIIQEFNLGISSHASITLWCKFCSWRVWGHCKPPHSDSLIWNTFFVNNSF